jgi:hypothetical protein
MTPNSSIFSTKSVLPRPTTIYTANGSHLDVSHIGSVSTHQLSMSNTYLVPNLSLNLLSVGQLCELGLELHFSKRGCDVQDPQTGQLIGTACKIRHLFELSSLHLSPTMSSATTSRSPSATLNLWHSRLGHASISFIHSLATSGQLGYVESESFDYVACQLGKQSVLPFNKSDSISSAPFDLVHFDVWGPMTPRLMGISINQ